MNNSKKVRVLIVDDEVDLVEILSSLFQLFQCEVLTAYNGVEALKIAQSNDLDIIVTDVRMPEMNGVELLKNIKKMQDKAPKVFMISGFTDFTLEQLYQLGVDGFFNKPFDASSLKNNIMQALAGPKITFSKKPVEIPELDAKKNFDSLEAAKKQHDFALGKLGFCLKIQGNEYIPKELINFNINFKNDPDFTNIQGIGEIKWVNADKKSPNLYYIGVEFKYLESACLDSFINWSKKNKIITSIPCQISVTTV